MKKIDDKIFIMGSSAIFLSVLGILLSSFIEFPIILLPIIIALLAFGILTLLLGRNNTDTESETKIEKSNKCSIKKIRLIFKILLIISMVFYLVIFIILVIMLVSPLISSNKYSSGVYEKDVYSGYRQDRIEVFYINKTGEHIPWDMIHDFNESPNYPHKYEEVVLLQIPANMTLVEAIDYCNNCSNILFTNPGSTYIRSVIQGDSHEITDLDPTGIYVTYIKNTSYRLPWAERYNISDKYYKYSIPGNMTFPEAFAYCNSIDDIVDIGFTYVAHPL